MAHLQVRYDYPYSPYRIISMLRGLGYSSLILEGDGRPNEWLLKPKILSSNTDIM